MRKVLNILSFFAVFFWMAQLKSTDSIYAVYVLVGICALFALYGNLKNNYKGNKAVIALAVLFSIFVSLSNYKMYDTFVEIERNVSLVMIPVGGFVAFYNIFVWLRRFALRYNWRKEKYKVPARRIFWLCFAGLSVLFILTQMLCCRPAVLTADSLEQLQMIDSGSYTDHHPFYHTQFIRLFYSPVLAMTGDRDFAIMIYASAQAIMMAAIFAYAIVTLYQLRLNKKIIIGVGLIFALLPCHLVFSFTVWKDVLFGGGILLFSVAIYRILNNIGKNSVLNYVFATLGALSICLFRGNGFYVFALVLPIFILMYRRTQLRLLAVLCGVLVVSFGLKMLVPVFGVVPGEPSEAFSIPLQQIVRVIVDDGNLTDEQIKKIEEIAPLNDFKTKYLEYISDPVKNVLRNAKKEEYLAAHKKEYLKLWLSIGINNSSSYLNAWVDQTRGYWNGGYYYWNITLQNDLDPDREVGFFEGLLGGSIEFFNKIGPFRIFLCIGLYVWILIITLYLSTVRKDKNLAFICVAPLGVIATLIVATPVFSEFRYAYSIFCFIPFALPLLFIKKPKKTAKRLKK